VIISPIFRDRMKWSREGSLANQISCFLFKLTNFAYKTSRFILHWKLGMDRFKSIDLKQDRFYRQDSENTVSNNPDVYLPVIIFWCLFPHTFQAPMIKAVNISKRVIALLQ
jgi:hypothetical protein